jgi:indole-3-glycerol phosphate synthase
MSKQNILEEIIAYKRKLVAEYKEIYHTRNFTRSPYFKRTTESLVQALRLAHSTQIIAEFKRKSPSKGTINETADVVETTSDYESYGAAGISILTDQQFFGGSSDDLLRSRAFVVKPILRKDFIIHEFQLLESKAMGADVILLIAACLTPREVRRLAIFAKNLGLEVLLELHDESELDHICPEVDLVGINNRNLKTFEVNWQHSIALAEKLPAGKPKIAESGIHNVDTLLMLKQAGFEGFLIGELFMKQTNPSAAFKKFVEELREKLPVPPAADDALPF